MTRGQALAVRLIADGDAEWFLSHPDRNYRVRLGQPAEVLMQRQAGRMERIPVGFKVFACIWQMEPRSRCTALCLGEATNDLDDASEEKAKTLFMLVVSRAATIH